MAANTCFKIHLAAHIALACLQHYVATLIAASQLGHETDCHGNLVSVQWDEGGAHPRSYNPDEINDDL